MKQDWQISKNRKNRNREMKKSMNRINEIKQDVTVITNTNTNTNTGNDIPLPTTYILWSHNIHSNDWSLTGYIKLCSIKTISEFWRLFNNLDKLGYKANNLFLMKEGTDPIWEHENNRDGGICSFRVTMDTSLLMYEDLCTRLMCNLLTDNMDDINGISYSPKNNWAIIKIWNKDKKNDLSVTLNSHILTTYKNNSIKYKSNEPEY